METLGMSGSALPLAVEGGPAAVTVSELTIPLRVTPLPDGTGLRLVGELDIQTGPLLATALENVASTEERICLDLSGVTFVDVAGARVLVRAAQRLGNGRRLVLHHPPSPLLLVLEFFPRTGLQVETGLQLETGVQAETGARAGTEAQIETEER